jgi:DNA-binding NtrC family response regulator
LSAEAEYLREEIKTHHNGDDIVGHSEPLLRTMRDVDQVAPADTAVLILGETGTGKELVARAIHAASPRRDRPFVKINCATIPATLMESELRHERGLSPRRRVGRALRAGGQRDDLPGRGRRVAAGPAGQLLRVLQEKEFEPIGATCTEGGRPRAGGDEPGSSAGVRSGEFREDLYYRLNVFPIHVPPLRDRGEDIALLACVFAKRSAYKRGVRSNRCPRVPPAPDGVQLAWKRPRTPECHRARRHHCARRQLNLDPFPPRTAESILPPDHEAGLAPPSASKPRPN